LRINIKVYPVYLYQYVNGELSTNYIAFDSINQLSKYLSISRETISLYLNTYVPYKGNLFLTDRVFRNNREIS